MQAKERGSVVGYVLGAVVLLALLLGGITLYKNFVGRPGGASDNQVATQNDDTEGDDQAAQNEAALKKQQEEAEKKAQEQNRATNSQDSNDKATEVPRTSTAPSLPATGPEDIFVSALGVAGLVGALVAYVRSRTAL